MTAPAVDDGPIVTFEIMLEWKETDDDIVPFSPDEKALALAVARAYYFGIVNLLCAELLIRQEGVSPHRDRTPYAAAVPVTSCHI